MTLFLTLKFILGILHIRLYSIGPIGYTTPMPKLKLKVVITLQEKHEA